MDQQAGWKVVLRFVQALVWPALLFSLFMSFHRPVESLIDRVATLRGYGVDAAFSTGTLTTANLPKTVQRPRNPIGPPRPDIHAVDLVPFPLVRGTVMAGMAVFSNTGQAETRVAVFHYVRIVDTPSPKRQEQLEDGYFNAFLGQISNDTPTFTMPANSLGLSWNLGPILSGDVLDGFNAGTKTIYFMGEMRYQIGQERLQAEYCRYTSSRGTFVCKHHNEVIR